MRVRICGKKLIYNVKIKLYQIGHVALDSISTIQSLYAESKPSS